MRHNTREEVKTVNGAVPTKALGATLSDGSDSYHDLDRMALGAMLPGVTPGP